MTTPIVEAYFDGACRGGNPGNCSYAFTVCSRHIPKDPLCLIGGLITGKQTNNFAEYTALIKLLHWLRDWGIKNALIYGDSQLVINQVLGKYKCRAPQLQDLFHEALGLYEQGGHILIHIRGHQGIPGNEAVDAKCNELLDLEEIRGDSTGSK